LFPLWFRPFRSGSQGGIRREACPKRFVQNGDSWASEIARVYAFRGEKDRAFEWLNRAYEARDEDLYFIKGDPLFKNLEGDPRYKAYLRKMNLPELPG